MLTQEDREKKFQRELGVGMNVSMEASATAQPAPIAPRPLRLNETIARLGGLGGSRGE